MNLAAAILNQSRASDVEMRLARLVAPFVSVLSFFELLDELLKRRVTVTDAPAGYCGKSSSMNSLDVV